MTTRKLDGRPAPKVRPDRTGTAHVEVISVGRDLLRGHVGNDNARKLAEFFSQQGYLVHRITAVDDNERVVTNAVREALERHPNLVVVTGGLGPAHDDRALAGVAEALGLPLSMNEQARTMVEDAYRRLAKARLTSSPGMNMAREKMCRIPVGGTPVANERGIAPGVLCRLPGGALVLCLPGHPAEMNSVLKAAQPLLSNDLPAPTHVARREIESPTPDESALRPLLEKLIDEFPAVWITSHPSGERHLQKGARTMITLEAMGQSVELAQERVETAVRRLLALVSGSR